MADAPLIRRIEALFPMLARGKFVERCDDHLARAIETLEALPEGKGRAVISITLTIDFNDGAASILPVAKLKLPDEKGFANTTFWTHEGALSIQHPNQFDMFPREASPAKAASA